MDRAELKSRLGNLEIEGATGKPTLGVALMMHFAAHEDRPDSDHEDGDSWASWVMTKVNFAIDKIADELAPNVISTTPKTQP